MTDTPKPIPRRVRFEILRRDNHTCRYCGAKAPDTPLTVDHVIPRVLGGSDDPSNLITACFPCNSGKASTSPDEYVVADVEDKAIRWAQAIERAATTRRAQMARLQDQLDYFAVHWDGWTWTDDEGEKHGLLRDGNWPDSIARFLELGLDDDDLNHIIGVAMRAPRVAKEDVWRYFCGCCWQELRRRQEMARADVDSDDDDFDEESPEFMAGYEAGWHDGRLPFVSDRRALEVYNDPSDVDTSDLAE